MHPQWLSQAVPNTKRAIMTFELRGPISTGIFTGWAAVGCFLGLCGPLCVKSEGLYGGGCCSQGSYVPD